MALIRHVTQLLLDVLVCPLSPSARGPIECGWARGTLQEGDPRVEACRLRRRQDGKRCRPALRAEEEGDAAIGLGGGAAGS